MNVDFLDAFSHTILQMDSVDEIHWFAKHTLGSKVRSKMWLIEEVKKIIEPKTAAVLGSWYTTILPTSFPNCNFTFVDVDDTLTNHNNHFLSRINLKNNRFIISDARTFVNASNENYDLIINTSCEHMKYDMKGVIWNSAPLYAFQSNNYDISEHVNIKSSLDEFVDSTGLTTVLYSGVLPEKKYDRYMVIGRL